MKSRSKAANRKATSNPEYETGYGKPPVSTRFKPGQSGNPRGRPKAEFVTEERLKSIFLKEAYRTIKVNEANGQLTIPMAQAVVRAIGVNAAKGKPQAQKLFIESVIAFEREKKELNDRYIEAAIEYKTTWDVELAYRRRHGIIAPDPVPHPDDILIDPWAGSVRIVGPMTMEEKALLERIRPKHDAAATEETQASSSPEPQVDPVKRVRLRRPTQ
jgi:hypothetical protein